MTLSYVWEKLYLAVLGMAHSPASLRDRVADAYLHHLIHIRREVLPPDLRPMLDEIIVVVSTTKVQGDEGDVVASIRTASAESVEAAARKITALYDYVSALHRHE